MLNTSQWVRKSDFYNYVPSLTVSEIERAIPSKCRILEETTGLIVSHLNWTAGVDKKNTGTAGKKDG